MLSQFYIKSYTTLPAIIASPITASTLFLSVLVHFVNDQCLRMFSLFFYEDEDFGGWLRTESWFYDVNIVLASAGIG